MADETVIIPLAQSLLECLVDELALHIDPPANACLRAGDIVIHDVNAATSSDTICCPGTVYVRIDGVYPSSSFPEPDTQPAKGAGNCFPVAWALRLVMGVVRCVPNMGAPAGPSCTDWTLVAQHDANDMDAMRKALCCWAETLSRGRLWLAGESPAATLTANCIERQMPVLITIPRCC